MSAVPDSSGYWLSPSVIKLYRDTGLSLAVMPSIGEDEFVSLDIEAKYTDMSETVS